MLYITTYQLNRCYLSVSILFICRFNVRANAVCNSLMNNYKLTLTGLLQEFIWGSVCVFVFFYKTT